MKTAKRVSEILARLKEHPPQTQIDVMRGLTLRRTGGGQLVLRVHYSAHPDRDPVTHPEWKRQERQAYSSQAAWDREQEIVDEAGGGELVFADTLRKHWSKIVIETPRWLPDPGWRVEGGFDHGKTNPTALLRAYVDFDGTIIYAGEYYQPGREIWQHASVLKTMEHFDRMECIYADPTIFHSTSQQSQRPGHAPEMSRSCNELYCEEGIRSFCRFRDDRSDVSFAARLMSHWAHLENREPSVKIVCPKELFAGKPVPGLHNWGCPNLLWELLNTRRVKLDAQQLLHRNESEAIVDKDNHARDAMKYHLMSHPAPSSKSLGRRVDERTAHLWKGDPTTAALQSIRILEEEHQREHPAQHTWSGNASRIIREYVLGIRRHI